jgi:ADP-ribose pyrophosphatase
MSKPDIDRSTGPAFTHGSWVEVYIDTVKRGDREYKYARIVESGGRPGVAILPLRTDDGVVTIGLVQVWRIPLARYCWEIPRGFGESSDPADDAVRELSEEVGVMVSPEQLIPLGDVLPNSGLLAGEVRVFAVHVRTKEISSPHDDEITALAWIPVDEVLARIHAGDINDAFTMVAVLRARLSGLL